MAVALLGRLLCVAVLVSSSSAQAPANIAVGKTATQSSTFDGTDKYASPPLTYRASADLAVDGAPTKNYADKTCAVTDWLNDGSCTNNPWWRVDLGGLHDVFNVTIYQRGEGANNRGPLVVWVGDHVERPENRTAYKDRPVIPLSFDPPVRASSVNISIIGCDILQLCEVEVFAIKYVNECASNPCQYGGSCTDGVSSYTCQCVPGYTDPNCATNIDECAGNPCQHRGNCTDGVSSYTCACQPGYTGVNCETDINECESSPCRNGASCQDLLDSFKCDCLPGYSGTTCETEIDECSSSPCSHNSHCVDGINNYTCYCAPGYTGLNCLQSCSGGTYGPGCSVACSAHCPETSDRGGQHCDGTTGQCLLQTGCKDGFQGLQCDTKQQTVPADRYTEGLGAGVGVGLGASLLLALTVFVLLRWRRRRKSLDERCPAGDIQLSSSQVQEATSQQEVAPGHVPGYYESLDFSSKDVGHAGPYAELGETVEGQRAANVYTNMST